MGLRAALGVSRAGFHAWRGRALCAGGHADALGGEITVERASFAAIVTELKSPN